MHSDLTNMERAEVLTAALPYIRRYTGKVVVVKYGGNAMINDQLKQQVMEDIGKKPEFVDGLRVTDKETMDIVQMVLAGKINKTLVNLLEMKGGKVDMPRDIRQRNLIRQMILHVLDGIVDCFDPVHPVSLLS